MRFQGLRKQGMFPAMRTLQENEAFIREKFHETGATAYGFMSVDDYGRLQEKPAPGTIFEALEHHDFSIPTPFWDVEHRTEPGWDEDQ
jgi:hypothetical protein